MGTYFAGMKSSIDSVKGYIPDNAVALIILSKKGKNIIEDIRKNTLEVFLLKGRHIKDLRRLAKDKYDWKNVSKKIVCL